MEKYVFVRRRLTRKMNILLITTHFPPKRGGVETSNTHYLDFFEKQENFQLIVLTYDNRYRVKFNDHWKKSKVIRIQVPAPLLDYMIELKSVSKLNSFFKKALYLLLHTYYLLTGSLVHLKEILQADKILVNGALIESITGYVVSILTRKKYSVRWRTDLSGGLVNKAIELCFRRASRIGVNGKDIKEKIIKLTGFSESRVFVSKHAVNTEIFYPVSLVKARTNLNLPLNKFIILFVAALNETKFCDLIVDSVPALFQNDYDFFLVFIGEGPLEYAVEKLKKLYISNILFINHFVKPETLNLYVNASDITIGSADIYYPARVVPESLACGTPVLIFNTSAHLEKRNRELKFKIPLPHVFTVSPSQDELCASLMKNKSEIHQIRNDEQLTEMSRQFILQNHGQEKIISNDIMRLLELKIPQRS
jgi:glycosyltransferase involved in cell wall biosynthesis